MDRDRALADLRREGGIIIHLAAAGELDAPVPSCPEWTYGDLLDHLGNVYNWVGTILAERLVESPPRGSLPQREEGTSGLDWMTGRFDRVITVLDSVPLDAEVWNFGRTSPSAPDFWWRRQLHETTIHRVDAEGARGLPLTPIDPALAADAVQEVFDLFGFEEVPADELTRDEPASDGAGLLLHLHATDVEGAEWTIDTSRRKVAKAHLKGDVALRGPAWALDRWLWGRPVGGDLETFGDLEAAEAWRASVVP